MAARKSVPDESGDTRARKLSFKAELIAQFIQRRKDLGLTQSELEARIGVAEALVAKWETGQREPSLFLAHCWATALESDLILGPSDKLAFFRRRKQ